MLTVKARIPRGTGDSPVLPVVIPDLSEVRAFAGHLHATGKPWQGEIFGWPAEYTPESRKRPPDSKMRFTPAAFWIGESGIWFYSLMWEHGKNQEPVAFLDERGIIKGREEGQMDPLELKFERRLKDAIRESIALGYNPTRIAEMINIHGGKETAKLLVKTGEIQDGLRHIVEMGYPWLSVESIMLEPEFAPLFTPDELEAARWRFERARADEQEHQ